MSCKEITELYFPDDDETLAFVRSITESVRPLTPEQSA
jgi:hypothetical protein